MPERSEGKIFLTWIFKENQAITIYRLMAVEGGDINKIRFGVLEDQKDIFSYVRYLFLFFSANIEFIYSVWYRPKSV